jgi:hypothetical protein
MAPKTKTATTDGTASALPPETPAVRFSVKPRLDLARKKIGITPAMRDALLKGHRRRREAVALDAKRRRAPRPTQKPPVPEGHRPSDQELREKLGPAPVIAS